MEASSSSRALPKTSPADGPLLHELFEAAADRRPGATAVVCGDASLTYRELESRVNRLARLLREKGIGEEDRVGVLLPRGADAYAAVLAILKAGAAYVPLDPEIPGDRAAFILQDSGAKGLLTVTSLGAKVPPSEGCFQLRLDAAADVIAAQPDARLSRQETGLSPDNLCYVIYTSGTTGRPKGVEVEHRNVVHLVEAESRLCAVRADDRVLQFSSLAFDASVEEIWLAFRHGAVLVAATQELLRAGPEIPKILARQEVSVLSCAPTFLALLEEDVPSVRLLLLGGEVCPPDLAARWHRPGRALLNVYGPTETTCIATAAVLEPGRPVTIGRPIAGCTVRLLDAELVPVPAGMEGEICIGGAGVARGYRGRPELQREKFIVWEGPAGPERLYRTGDQGRLTSQGELEYRGRLDGQVKLRGYRVELAEIEALLLQCPGVLAAAASAHAETQRVAAYIVPRSDARPDREAIRRALAARLPAYMVPAFLDELPALPQTVSGKIDRRALPPPRSPLEAPGRRRVEPRDERERSVAGVWEAVLGRPGISVDEDFFKDLDGHSILATTAVSRLRRLPGFERVSVADLYAHPTVEGLAALGRERGAAPSPRPYRRASGVSYALCAAGQALGILFIAGLNSWQWLGEYLVYGYLVVDDWPVRKALLVALGVYLVTTPAMLLLSIALKWLLLGRIKPGSYPLWGWFYWRYWFVRSCMHAAPVHYLAGTPLIILYYRLMGARIGKDVYIGQPGGRRAGGLTTPDLLRVGDGVSIGAESSLDGATVEGGLLRLGAVSIGRGCWIGNRCSVGSDAVMEDGSGLGDLSMLPSGSRVPAGELWRGSPAAPAGRLEPEPARSPWSLGTAVLLGLGAWLAPLAVIATVFPGFIVLTGFGHYTDGFAFLLWSPLAALSYILLLCAETWVLKALILGRLREGRYPLAGWYYLRYWLSDRVLWLSLEALGTLYTTLYVPHWLRGLGARIGERSEFDHIDLQPDLFEAGPECFLAGYVMAGAPNVRGGWIRFGKVRLGRRSFAGASVLLPQGTRLGDDVLIGTYSVPPAAPEGVPVPDGSTWFGSPPIRIPSRHRIEGFDSARLFKPSPGLVALRLFFELFHVVLPSTFFLVLTSLIVSATDRLQDYAGLGVWLLLLPVLYMGAALLAVLITVAAKWLLIGRFKAGEKPLWCAFVWRCEIALAIYDYLCVPFVMEMLRGTPFIVWPLRALGMSVGKRCYIDTTWFMCADLISIGDEAELNNNCAPMEQLYEGRVMKMGRVRIGARAVLGAESAMQYDSELGDGAALEELTLVMKGDLLPPHTRWRGLPARPAEARLGSPVSRAVAPAGDLFVEKSP